jgi:hypothetical protein
MKLVTMKTSKQRPDRGQGPGAGIERPEGIALRHALPEDRSHQDDQDADFGQQHDGQQPSASLYPAVGDDGDEEADHKGRYRPMQPAGTASRPTEYCSGVKPDRVKDEANG